MVDVSRLENMPITKILHFSRKEIIIRGLACWDDETGANTVRVFPPGKGDEDLNELADCK